jgi:hypothetical protein
MNEFISQFAVVTTPLITLGIAFKKSIKNSIKESESRLETEIRLLRSDFIGHLRDHTKS